MAVTLSPIVGAGNQFFDNNGNPLSGGKIYTYFAGTSTPQATYTTYIGNIQHSNPIILDSSGRIPGSSEIWLTVGASYKFILKTSSDVLISTLDNIPSAPQPALANDSEYIAFESGYEVNAGSFTSGITYKISEIGTTDFTLIGASSNTVGVHFIATGAGSGTGKALFSRTVQTKLRETVSVKDFGAVGDGIADDTNAIQQAIDYVETSTKIYFPSGNYKITNQINVNKTIEIFGDGWSPYSGVSPTLGNGTILLCEFEKTVADNLFYVTAPNVQFKDLEILCTYQPDDIPGWTPTETPNAIQFYRPPYVVEGGEDGIVSNVMIAWMSVGVYVKGADRGDFDITGFTLGPLLYIDGNYDVTHVRNIQYWPFQSAAGMTNVMEWVSNNVYAVQLGRSDNPVFDKVFAYGVYAGIYFGPSTASPSGSVQNAQFSNLGVDACYHGILVDSPGQQTLEINSLYVYCNGAIGSSSAPSRGIWFKSNPGNSFVNIGNLVFYDCGGEAIRIDSQGTNVKIANLKIGDAYHAGYNQQNNNFNAIYANNSDITIDIGQYQIKTSDAYGALEFKANSNSKITVAARPSILHNDSGTSDSGYEQYMANIDTSGAPVMVTRNFGRTIVNISGSGNYTWTCNLTVPVTTRVLNARVSSGSSSLYNITNLCIYPNVGMPLGAKTTATGSFDTTATSGSVCVDWEVFGY